MPDKLPRHAADAVPPQCAMTHALRPPSGARRYISEQLFGDTTEVEILHGESVYRLRLTSLGKLILTK